MSRPVRISVRAAPGAIAWHIPTIKAGEPFADVNANRSIFHFDNADTNDPGPSLRAWMIEGVRNAVHQDGLKRWIIWPDLSVTSFVGPNLTPHLRPAKPQYHGPQHV